MLILFTDDFVSSFFCFNKNTALHACDTFFISSIFWVGKIDSKILGFHVFLHMITFLCFYSFSILNYYFSSSLLSQELLCFLLIALYWPESIRYGYKGVECNKLLVLQIICIGVQGMFYLPQWVRASVAAYHHQPNLLPKLIQM